MENKEELVKEEISDIMKVSYTLLNRINELSEARENMITNAKKIKGNYDKLLEERNSTLINIQSTERLISILEPMKEDSLNEALEENKEILEKSRMDLTKITEALELAIKELNNYELAIEKSAISIDTLVDFGLHTGLVMRDENK